MIAMLVGTALALAALAYVLYPLLHDTDGHELRVARPGDAPPSAIDALRDVEFDFATGKLSDVDYQSLKSAYTYKAAGELRGEAVATVCPACGATPEPDAVYCSTCGARLAL